MPSQYVADLLQSMMRPGIEVCGPHAEVDSQNITNIYVLTGAGRLTLEEVQSVNKRVSGKIAPSATMVLVTI